MGRPRPTRMAAGDARHGFHAPSSHPGAVALATLLSLGASSPAFAHTGAPLEPHDLWAAWSLEPASLGLLGTVTWLYARGVRRLWQRAGTGRGVRPWRVYCFGAGVFVLVVALLSPVDALGSALFSAHMTQHLLLMVPAPLLLVLGAPLLPLLYAFSPQVRRKIAQTWRRARPVHAIAALLCNGPVVWLLNTVVLWAWHSPRLFEAALRSEPVHMAEHASFLVVSLLLWGVLFPARRSWRRHGAGVLLVVATAMQGGLLAAVLVFAESPWYATYGGSTTAWGLTPMEDQQLAGAIMWVPAGIAYLTVATTLFLMWLAGPPRSEYSAAVVAGIPSTLHPVPSVARSSAVTVLLLALLIGCDRQGPSRSTISVAGGDRDEGRRLISFYGCGSCHTIPGVRGARGTVGPPLTAFASRDFIAGKFTNQPENLTAWIMDAPALDPGVAMPDLGVTESQARHIAAYLYTLR